MKTMILFLILFMIMAVSCKNDPKNDLNIGYYNIETLKLVSYINDIAEVSADSVISIQTGIDSLNEYLETNHDLISKSIQNFVQEQLIIIEQKTGNEFEFFKGNLY